MKISVLFLPVFLLIPFLGYTQITIESNDLPNAETQYYRVTASPSLDIDPGVSGTDITWDYSDLDSFAAATSEYIDIDDAPDVFKFVMLGADLYSSGIPANLNSSLPVEVNEPLSFYNKSQSEFSTIGIGFEFNETPFPVRYEEKDVLYDLPLNYADSNVNPSSFDFSIPGVVSFVREQERKTVVDAWGKLILPDAEFDVIRVRQEMVINDSFNVQGFGTKLPERISVDYEWLAKGYGVSVLRISGNLVFGEFIPSSVNFYSENAQQTGFFNEYDSYDNGLQILGNPVHNEELLVKVDLKQNNLNYNIINSQGQSVQEGLVSGGINRIQFNTNLRGGIYILRIGRNSERFIVH